MRSVIAIVIAGVCGSLARPVAAADVVAVVQLPAAAPAARGRATERALARILGRLELEVVDLAEARRRLLADEAAAGARRRAHRQIAEASQLRRHMQYERATEATARAEAQARAGLAQLVEPALLAEVHLQRGLVLLPTRPARARRSLLASLRLRPLAELDAARYSPKIVAELQRVARQARDREVAPARAGPVTSAAARQVATILRARYLLFASRSGGRLRLQIYDARGRRWRSTGPVRLAAATRAERRRRTGSLRAALGLPPPPPVLGPPPRRIDVPPTGDRSTAWPWFVAGGGVVAAATGIALWAVSGDRVASAESLAGQTPLREYGADAEALESSARQLRAGAVVFLAVGAAALVTAATGWLLRPGRDRSRDGRDRASDGRDRAPAATGVTARIEPAGLTIRFP